tara:strand:+ start:93 stop:266 length:174 start_codon:yes stop_codon:yes gene_type:complete
MIINEITREMFEEYKDIQASGKYNMLSPQARDMSSMDKKQWFAIIKNYDELEKKYSC